MNDPDMQRLSTEIRDSEARVRESIGVLRGELSSHLNDRYAHQVAMEPWYQWRGGVDKWRWVTMGGLSVLSALVGGAFAAVIAAYALHLIH